MNIIVTKCPCITRTFVSAIHEYLVCVNHGQLVCDLHDQYTHLFDTYTHLKTNLNFINLNTL